MSKSTQGKKSKFIINIPLFVSKRKPAETLFSRTYDTLIVEAESQINSYNKKKDYIILNKRNKFFERQIGNIEYKHCKIGDKPGLLLNVSAYTLNKMGEHIKESEVVPIEPRDRIGDDKNYILLLPEITNEANSHYNWLALVYDDPTRESEEIIAIAKAIMSDILREPIKNIKLPTLLNELRQAPSPVITLTLNSVNNDEGGIGSKFQIYETETKSFVKHEYRYSGMPIEKIKELIEEKFENRFKNKMLKFLLGEKEYKIKQDIDDFKDGANLLVEQYFNFEEKISSDDFDHIYTQPYILDVMNKVIIKYFTNGEK